MEIQYGQAQDALVIKPTELVVRVPIEDKERVLALVGSAKILPAVTDEISAQGARHMAGRLKAMEKEIYGDKRAAKAPFEAILATIETLATNLWAEGKTQQERLVGSLKAFLDKQEKEREAALAKEAAERRAREQEAAAKLREAQRAQDLAKAAQFKAEMDLADELDRAFDAASPPPPKPVPHKWKFRLVDLPAVINNHRLELLRWELDHLACQDAVRLQLERNPEKTPVLPGIEITKEISVTIKAQGRSA